MESSGGPWTRIVPLCVIFRPEFPREPSILMAVVIRMKKTGRRNAPSYRISVSDSRRPRDGRTIENLGLYDPRSKQQDKQLTLNVESARAWLSKGAQPSETVLSIFKKMGVVQGEWPVRKKRDRSGRSKTTKARTSRRASKASRTERKTTRRTERLAKRRADAKAAKGAEAAPAAE